jgi:hypothetical protein
MLKGKAMIEKEYEARCDFCPGSVKMYARRATWSRDFTATRALHLVGLGVSLASPYACLSFPFFLWLAVMERSISANTYGGIELGRM